VAERQFGPYRLVRQIAVGGMAEIHLAKTGGIAGFEKYVALKMIHPNFAEDEQFIQMLVDEAKIAVQLTHGNIAQTFDLGRVGETYYITMEYVDGADLYKILRRASEQDLEMPLDVCAFIGKEVSSALDHAHRKRDHAGKSLGIVHRDVSPQNVLVSYSGEVKLVDFGIAKATMKVRQTAVGVIKGKYYYMSPEQAWGDPIDHRSDIFSAGIVLYEMITGQMMYLEEDLHKLLEMARKAEVPPPSKLRRGVPPQLERIVMHALAKVPGERYQSAGDLATDLERFLHAYSPVFTASKLSTLVRHVVGDPIQVPDDPGFVSIEFRDGVMSTHPLDDSEVAHAIDAEELRDENSVIFRVSELDKRPIERSETNGRPSGSSQSSQRPSAPPQRPSTPPPVPAAVRPSAPRVTRATDPMPALPAVPRGSARPASSAPRAVTPGAAQPAAPRGSARLPQVAKPRHPHEETRQLDQPAPPDPLADDSGLLTPDGQKLGWIESDRSVTADDLDNIGERTLITGAPGMAGAPGIGFMMDVAGEDADGQIEATLVTGAPTGFGLDAGQDSTDDDGDDEDGPTLSRDFSRDHPTKPARPAIKPPPPAALAAKIHAPAVSELRKPRPSRRTPPGGMPVASANVLHAIVASKAGEPMPVPRPALSSSPPASVAMQATVAMPPAPQVGMAQPGMAPGMLAQPGTAASMAPTMVPGLHAPSDPYAAPPFPVGTPGAQQPYYHDASGLPLGMPTPPGVTVQATPGPYQIPAVHPGYLGQPLATQMSPAGYPQLSPNALYGLQGPPQPASLTGQLRWSEVDEIPSQYKLGAARWRWFTYIVSGLIAVSVAAGVTFLVIRLTREATPSAASVRVVSVPAGADVTFDGTLLGERTTMTVEAVPVASRHKIVVSLRHYQPYTEEITIPRTGGTVQVMAQLTSQTGKIVINTTPGGAQIWINGQPRGTTPTTLSGIDIDSTSSIELLHKDFGKYAVPLKWDAAGVAYVDYKFSH
jgi:serine/threonine protein kinase